MKRFEVLCVTMNQRDLTKYNEMNLKCNVVFANQGIETSYHEEIIDGHRIRMISTNTKGVGINRNIAQMYADADICLYADDDINYVDGLENIILLEFDKHPDADIIIFNLESSDDKRKQIKYKNTRKYRCWEKMPWGAVRIAFRLNSVKKANLWFTPLFGGGTMYPSGEDSMWLTDAKKKGLKFYVSKEVIGRINFDESSWFTGYDSKFFWGKGAFFRANHPKLYGLMIVYFIIRSRGLSDLSCLEKLKWMKLGSEDYVSGKIYTY